MGTASATAIYDIPAHDITEIHGVSPQYLNPNLNPNQPLNPDTKTQRNPRGLSLVPRP